MDVEELEHVNKCKYCDTTCDEITPEGLQCSECQQYVHLKCLKRGAVPGGLVGDVFFQFVCQECSTANSEQFIRDKMPWLQAILLVLYHMHARSPGLARKSYFHWKIHIAAFIDKNWDIIFRRDFKRKKKWTGTVSGTLSHYSPQFFKSGTQFFNEQGWWTLTYPTLTPYIIVQLNAELMMERQKLKELKITPDDAQLLKGLLLNKPYATEEILKTAAWCMETNPISPVQNTPNGHISNTHVPKLNYVRRTKPGINKKKKLPLLPTIDSLGSARIRKAMKNNKIAHAKNGDIISKLLKNTLKNYPRIVNPKEVTKTTIEEHKEKVPENQVIEKPSKFLDPMCHYDTSLFELNRIRGIRLKEKLVGELRKDPILSPYSSIYLTPYIRRDSAVNPPWLQLMDEIKSKVNQNNPNWTLPPRRPLNFMYVQPEHIPAINSLCNQFFWTGIDLSEALEYPDFSCVVLYRKLVIGFAFLIPDVQVNEGYLSFIFTRPGWRNVGIAKFMLYHIIQTSLGRDITLHVSISNPALFLYQKYGFKVEYVVLDFYKRYMRDDARESKHAFFCRLER